MTVVIWDGERETVAFDSRRRDNGEVTNDNAIKGSVTYPNGRVRGKKVLIAVSAGNVKTTSEIKRALRAGHDIEEVFKKMYKAKELEDYRLGSLFILTQKNAYVFRVGGKGKPSMQVVSKNEIVVLGTGGRYARFMVEVFKVSPMIAVAATMLHKHCCGGPVRYYKRPFSLAGTTLGGGSVKTMRFADEKDLEQKVKDEVRKKCLRSLQAD